MTIPITILTGFLGSGKTTLLNELVKRPELKDAAVLINEFGDVGLDHLLVNELDEEVILLESGCVCCSVRDDFAQTLLELYQKRKEGIVPPFNHVILETTGIADPSSLHQLIVSDKDTLRFYHYHKTLTVVDAIFGLDTLKTYGEAVHQVSIADLLIISKCDLAENHLANQLSDELTNLNPIARIVRNRNDDKSLSDILREVFDDHHKSIQRETKVSSPSDIHHGNRFTTYTLTWEEPVKWEVFQLWLEGLLIVRGDSILRLKGWLYKDGDPLPVVIQGVQHSFYPPTHLESWPNGRKETELVFITCDFNKTAAQQSISDMMDLTPA